MTFYTFLFDIVLLKIYLVYSILLFCRIFGMTYSTGFTTDRLLQYSDVTVLRMLLTWSMACLTADITVHILLFKIIYILMTVKADFLSGVLHRDLFIFLKRSTTIKTILPECFWNQEVP
ncbi:MAG TPA: hypothetical protein VFB86_06735 [Bacteroidales bacterium]|nr:hypothetical protein [Bacteroidales bacterium]